MMGKGMALYERIRKAGDRFISYVQAINDGDQEEYGMHVQEGHGVARESRFSFRQRCSEGLTLGFGAQILSGDDAIVSPPCLVLSNALLRELLYYFSTSAEEFQLMGIVRHDARNRFVVNEWVVNPHTAGIAHAELDQDMFPLWLDMLERQGKDIRMLRVQVHSHGILDAYFSATDVATIRDAYSCDWMISIVGNQACTILARLDIYKPIPLSISIPIACKSPQFTCTQAEEAAWKEKQMMADGTYLLKKGD